MSVRVSECFLCRYTLTADGAFDAATVDAEDVDTEGGWPLPDFNSWHPNFLCHPCSEAFIEEQASE